jgi:hypothetical protein
MRRNDSRGVKSDPTDRSTDAHQGRGDTAAEQASAENEPPRGGATAGTRGCAGAGPRPPRQSGGQTSKPADRGRLVPDGGQTQKTITGWLVVDWKGETHRTRKSKPSASELGANELLAELRVNVTVPEVETPTLTVNIDVPKPQVEAAELAALDEDELPDWTDAVHKRLADVDVDIEDVPDLDPVERRALENDVALDVLEAVPTRPDPAAVREYVYETIERVAADEAGDEQ